MTEAEWEQQRLRANMAAFQKARPVFGDLEGDLRFADGACEDVPVVATPPAPPRLTWWQRILRLRFLRGTR